MKNLFRMLAVAMIAVLSSLALASSPPDRLSFRPYSSDSPPATFKLTTSLQVPPPPTTYNIEAIYDKDSKAAAIGASAFWKRFTRKDKNFDVHFFGGLDKRQIPVGAILGKFKWSPVDQLDVSFGPALELKQSKLIGLTLFVGVSLR